MTMQTTELPTSNPAAQAVVDLDAIQHNVRLLREHAGSAQVMVVLKADGYGHGATQVARSALAAGAAELGVATLDEALAIRRDGVTAPLLAWLHAPGTDFAPALTADVQLAVSSARGDRDRSMGRKNNDWQSRMAAMYGIKQGHPIHPIHL